MGIFGFIKSSIGQKYVVATTGLLFALFVLSHVLGNFLIFVGPEAYNMYSYKLISNPFIIVAEIGLVVLFVVHLAVAIKLTASNMVARPDKYALQAKGKKKTDPVTKAMWIQGAVIFIFMVSHLITFKYGTYYTAEYDGLVVRDLYKLMVEVFASPLFVVGYVLCMVMLGLHLSHGIQSALKTFGFNHPQYEAKVRTVGLGVALIVSLGFIAQPVYIFFFQ
ncbi:MAG: succinate dehydrogenase cytochrome b subunit [Bdellovibrionaceae bacterium]|jgi:succinate dehydrogenase / fumarate reductase, cytochrome b subunit|nr:succinate dehydrogenase cytochrome b subunit [Pseudobdellovibrionaceae bacterium]